MAFQVQVDLGSGWEDISAYLAGRYPVRRRRAIHTADRPTTPEIGTARFQIVRNITLINRFFSASTPAKVWIKKDGSDYFTGNIRNTHRVKVGLVQADAFDIECVDSWMRLDKKCLLTATWSNYTYSNPASKSTSILHQLFYSAGFSDSELSLPTIAITRDRAVFDATQGKTYREIIELIITELGYSARVNESGVVTLYDLGPTSITTSATLSSGNGGNISAGYEIQKNEAKQEAVDVTYWDHLAKSGATVFEDTKDATSTQACNIPLGAGEYYPSGADATHDVRGEYKLEGYEIIATVSQVIAWNHDGDVSKQVETPDGLGMKMRFYSASSGVITRLAVIANAIVKGDMAKVVRENVANAEKREDVKCEWIYAQADAERLAIIRANWHANSAYTWNIETTLLSLNPGDYIALSESSIMGASQTLRVVSVEDGDNQKSIKIVCEGASVYSYAALPKSNTLGIPALNPAQPLALAAQASADSASKTWAQTSAPTIGSRPNAINGDHWIDTDDSNKEYVAVGGSWVLITGAGPTGPSGSPGTNALSLILTPRSSVVLSNTDGTSPSPSTIDIVVKVLDGTTDVTGAQTPTATPSGCSVSAWDSANKKFTATYPNSTVKDGWIDITVTNGGRTVTERWSYAKALLGNTGSTGSAGATAPNLLTQYSNDGSTGWTSVYDAAKLYMRTSNDAGSTWSTALKIVGPQGIQGTQGIQGDPAPANFTWVLRGYATNPTPASVSRAGSGSTWDSAANSAEAFPAGSVAWTAGTSPEFAVGLSDNVSDITYGGARYGFWFHGNGLKIVKAAVPYILQSSWLATDRFLVSYDGIIFRYYFNGTLVDQCYAPGLQVKLHVGVAYNSANITNIQFNPSGSSLNSWTAVMLGGVTYANNRFAKTSGNNGVWDGQVYSLEAYQSCIVQFSADDTTSYRMVGLSTNPFSSRSFSPINYAWYCSAGNDLRIYELGSDIGNFGAYTTETKLTITYDGYYIRYLKDGVLKRSVAAGIYSFYLDASVYYVSAGGSIRNLTFGRFIAATEIVAGSITANEIAANTITANEINVASLFAQDIVVGNAIRGGSTILDGAHTGFRLDSAGLLQASNAVIYGTIYASAGTFAGSLSGATGTFAGSLTAASISAGSYIENYGGTIRITADYSGSGVEGILLASYDMSSANSPINPPAYSALWNIERYYLNRDADFGVTHRVHEFTEKTRATKSDGSWDSTKYTMIKHHVELDASGGDSFYLTEMAYASSSNWASIDIFATSPRIHLSIRDSAASATRGIDFQRYSSGLPVAGTSFAPDVDAVTYLGTANLRWAGGYFWGPLYARIKNGNKYVAGGSSKTCGTIFNDLSTYCPVVGEYTMVSGSLFSPGNGNYPIFCLERYSNTVIRGHYVNASGSQLYTTWTSGDGGTETWGINICI